VDVFSKVRRSEIMRAIRSTDTSPELIVRRVLHRLGFRFRLHRKDLPGCPDLVLPKWNIAIFIHGCFWHGHDCRRGSKNRKPKSNQAYWTRKLNRNITRDAENGERLTALGWRRVIVWECETANTEALARRLLALLAPSSTILNHRNRS
jgi:DNA mismatch endonuclease (patch repair protein)